jgi:hypothetical protein
MLSILQRYVRYGNIVKIPLHFMQLIAEINNKGMPLSVLAAASRAMETSAPIGAREEGILFCQAQMRDSAGYWWSYPPPRQRNKWSVSCSTG